ncbi:hypothetical protein BC832DRAFT_593372 [Gaertneriomyces semiglobifer]|nr:hypothetical protein BC832DRAFT_593372 [Gaertneriomyces semiglobifer]
MSDSDDSGTDFDWRDVVHYPGIDEVPRGQEDAFIRSARAELQTRYRTDIESLKETFPTEFGSIKAVQDPDTVNETLQDIIMAFPESVRDTIKIPASVIEYLFLTGDTEATASADFGLPIVTNEPHPEVPGYLKIELDYDECSDELDTYPLYIKLVQQRGKASKKKATDDSLGRLFLGTKTGLKPTNCDFEEFISKWARFMCEDFVEADAVGAAVVEFLHAI